jgi:hypothetical protein
MDPLSPQNKKEKLLSSPIRSKDTQGNNIELIGQEDDKIFWDTNGKRYAKSSSGLYTRYTMDRKQSIEFRKELAKTHDYVAADLERNKFLINQLTTKTMKLTQLRKLIREEIQRTQENVELRPNSPQIKQYWSIMVENQPADVINMLTDLTSGKLSYDAFISATEEDIYDSFRDDDEDMDDEDMDDEDF